jgi:hypothetical protein
MVHRYILTLTEDCYKNIQKKYYGTVRYPSCCRVRTANYVTVAIDSKFLRSNRMIYQGISGLNRKRVAAGLSDSK